MLKKQLILLILLILTCTSCMSRLTNISKQEILNDFNSGKTKNFDTSFDAIYRWNSNVNSMIVMYNNNHWDLLVERVMQTAFEHDLAYFFLGRAAEETNNYDAALAYYEKSRLLHFSTSSLNHCRDVGKCAGIDLAAILPQRIDAVKIARNSNQNKPILSSSPWAL